PQPAPCCPEACLAGKPSPRKRCSCGPPGRLSGAWVLTSPPAYCLPGTTSSASKTCRTAAGARGGECWLAAVLPRGGTWVGPVAWARGLDWTSPFARCVSALAVVTGGFFLLLRNAAIAPPAAVSVARPAGFFQRRYRA